MFTLTVNLDGFNRKFDTGAASAADLAEPLGIFGGYLRKRAQERYKAQNFVPLAEGTVMHRAQKGMRQLENKLRGDVRKALRRARKDRQPAPRGLLERVLATKAMDRALDDALGAQTRGVKNRTSVLAEFQQHKRTKLKDRVQGQGLGLKQQVSLAQREARAVMKAIGRPILGGLGKTLGIKVGLGNVTLESTTREKWSKAHNEGASVGHGAQLPARPTIFVEESDLRVLESILKDHLLLPFEEGMQGPGY